jgi:hypothetical protein
MPFVRVVMVKAPLEPKQALGLIAINTFFSMDNRGTHGCFLEAA